MHHCLQIPEILYIILFYIDDVKSFHNFKLTSKLWYYLVQNNSKKWY